MSDESVPSSPLPFSDDELYLLSCLPGLVGSAITFSDVSGPVGTIKEMMANARARVAGRSNYPDNAIICAIVPEFDGRADAMAVARDIRSRQQQEYKAAGVESRDDMRDHAIEQAAKVNVLLTEKAEPNEAAEYREWVMSVAQATAEAAKEGGFLGIGGVRVSPDEQRTLDEIAAALGAEPVDG
jgi:hypothetical protein